MKLKSICVSVWSLLLICGVGVFLLLLSKPVKATTRETSYSVTISVSVGEPKLTLFGYTSPLALVKLEGNPVSEETRSDKNGYFFFDRVFLPFPRHQEDYYQGLCLTSLDTHQRASFPTCLPPLPLGPYTLTVGPVLLSPTLSLEKGKFLPQEQVAALGETIPDSKMTIFLAHASFLPKYEIQADKQGKFQFNLPTNQPATWRVFAATTFLNSPSPKSNTLTFGILSLWGWLWEKIKEILVWLFAFIKPHLWTIAILIECLIIGLTLIKSRIHADSRSRGA